MGQNSVSARQNSDLRDNYPIHISEDTELSVGSQNVLATVNTANGDIALMLPPVGPSAGTIISVEVSMANAKTLTLQDNNGDDPTFPAPGYDLDADADSIILYSTGIRWKPLYNGIA